MHYSVGNAPSCCWQCTKFAWRTPERVSEMYWWKRTIHCWMRCLGLRNCRRNCRRPQAKANDMSLSCHAPCLKVNVTTPPSKRKLLQLLKLCGSGVTIYTAARSPLITDQRSLAFMFDQRNRGKIKNAKIQAWRAELGMFSYDVSTGLGKKMLLPMPYREFVLWLVTLVV